MPALTLLLAACTGDDIPSPDVGPDVDEECEAVLARGAPDPHPRRPAGSQVAPGLRTIGGCSELAEELREQEIASMERELDFGLEYALLERCSFGEGGGGGGGAPPVPSPTDYSQTNVQVPGVDEPDFVKNDADYLYVAAGDGLQIIDAWPAPEAHVVAAFDIEGTPTKMFVDGDRALVYSSLDPESEPAWEDGWEPRSCTYGYSCDFAGDGNPTKITVLDIADRAKPAVEREIWLSGSLINARRIGTSVHTVVSEMDRGIEGVSYQPFGLDTYTATPDEIIAAYDRLRAENRRIIATASSQRFLPQVRDVVHGAAGPSENKVPLCDSTYASAVGDAAFTSVISLDLASVGQLSLTSVKTRPGAIYASADALYMAVPYQAWDLEAAPDGWENELSLVHKFSLASEPARAGYRGSGTVKGRVLNQFSLDERSGDLRIATTTGYAGDPLTHSTVTVLRESSGELATIGKIDRIAPREDIRSARFDGDTGYIVTFEKTDPLFVLDLADPERPRVAGELKIPGFSTYMHLMDPQHLLTIGYDADDQGDFSFFTGVLLQIFDVSDLAKPILAHREVIGTRGSSSEALTNHLAFNYFPARQSLALPMTVCEESSGGGDYGHEMTFSGLMVFGVTAASGFSRTGQVEHPPEQGIDCYNWWTDARSQVERSVFMEDYVFSISHARVKVNAMSELAEDLVDISLQ